MSIWDSSFNDTPAPAAPPPSTGLTPQAKKSIWDMPYGNFGQVDTSTLPPAPVPPKPNPQDQSAGKWWWEHRTPTGASITLPPAPRPQSTLERKGEEAGGLDAFAPPPPTVPPTAGAPTENILQTLNPLGSTQYKSTLEEAMAKETTPLSNAAQTLEAASRAHAQKLYPNYTPQQIDALMQQRGFDPMAALATPFVAMGQEAGGIINRGLGATQGQELSAGAVGPFLRNIPGLGLAELTTEAAFPQTRDYLTKTPLRDTPVLGAGARVAETAVGLLGVPLDVVGKPAVGFEQIGLQMAFKELTGQTTPQLDEAYDKFIKAVGSTDPLGETERVLRGKLTQEAERNPLTQGLEVVNDPLVFADVFKLAPSIRSLQELQRTMQSTMDVGKVGEAVKDMSPMEQLVFHTIARPTVIKAGEKVTDTALGLASNTGKVSELNRVRRLVTPFTTSPQSKLGNVITRIADNVTTRMADAGLPIADKFKWMELITGASRDETLMTPALKEFMGERGIVDSLDNRRVIRGALAFDTSTIQKEHAAAHDLINRLETNAKLPYARDLAEPLVEGAAKLSKGEAKGYRNIFDTAIDQWKTGKLNLTELRAQVDSLAGHRLATDFIEHSANTLAKASGVKPPSWITRQVNKMRAYEGLAYLSTNLGALVQNVTGDIGRGIMHGVEPRDLGAFYKRIGYKPPEELGQLVRQAVEGEKAGKTVRTAYGSEVPSRIQNLPGLKQVNQLFSKSQSYGRELAWANSFERFMTRNFKYGEHIPAMPAAVEQALKATLGEKEFKRVIADLEHGRNFKEAEAALFGHGRTWQAYREELGQAKSADLSAVAGRDVEITPDMAQEAHAIQDQVRLHDVMDEFNGRVANGEDAAAAFQEARKSVDEEIAGLEQRRGDLVSQWNEANNAKGTQARKNADALMGEIDATERRLDELKATPKPPDVPPEAPAAPAVEPQPPTQPPGAPSQPRYTPEDFTRQLENEVTQRRAPDPAVLREFARQLTEEPTLPNILKGRVDAADWAQMDAYGRQTLLERTLAQQRDAGNFGLSDVYQGRGDVPTAMPDVTNVPQAAPAPTDLSDVFYSAAQKGVGTADPNTGRTVNQHLLNVLNKHKEAGAARFTKIEDVRARADEAINILDGYTPEAKAAPPAAPVAEQVAPKAAEIPERIGTARVNRLAELSKLSRSELPTQLSENMRDAATELKFQLKEGQPGRRLSTYNQEEGGRTFMAEGSSNAPFYKELFAKYKVNKPAIETALNKIIKDKGLDKGVNVERVKEVILQSLADGLETSAGRMPPDWEARGLLGYSKEQVDEAWKIWDEANKASEVPEVGTQAAAQFGEVNKPTKAQGQLFSQGEDTPLFSGTPARAKESAFLPQEAQGTQGKMFSTAPEFKGAKKQFETPAQSGGLFSQPAPVAPAVGKYTEQQTTAAKLFKQAQPYMSDPLGLSGDSKVVARQKILSALRGEDVKKSKAGVNALRDELYKAFNINSDQTYAAMNSDLLERINEAAGIKPEVPPLSEGRMTLAGGEPQGLDALAQINYNHFYKSFNDAKNAGATSAVDPAISKAWNDAHLQHTLDTIGETIGKEGIPPKGALPPDLEALAREWLTKEYMPAQNTAKLGGNTAGRFGIESTALNYDNRYNIDDTLNFAAPFTYWWLHSILNYTKDFIEHPAMLAYLVKTRQMLDSLSADMPDRYKHTVAFPMPGGGGDLGDNIYINPTRGLMPVDQIYNLTPLERAGYTALKEDGSVDYNSAFGDMFGIHKPYQLAWALATGHPEELKNFVASLPAARVLRGLTQSITPGGIGMDGEMDVFYYERAAKELVADGTLTEDEAKIGFLQQGNDPNWLKIKERAGLENYSVREISGLFGMRGYAFTPGEQKYLESQKASAKLQQDAVVQLGGNPSMTPEQRYQFLSDHKFYSSDEWLNFKQEHPETEMGSFLGKAYSNPEEGSGKVSVRLPEDKAQLARERAYYLDKLAEVYYSVPELKQKMIGAYLGDDFKRLFLDKSTKNLDAIPRETYLGWANAVDELLAKPTAGTEPTQPDPFHVTFPTDDQNARFQKFYDDVEQSIGHDTLHQLESEYFSDTDKARRAAFLQQHPELKVEWDAESKFYEDNPDLLKIMEQAGLKKIPTQTSGAPTQGQALNQAVIAAGLNWDDIDKWKAEYNALPKGAARTAYRASHIGLVRYFQLSGALYNTDAELQQYQGGGGGGSSNYTPFYLRPSYNPRVATPRPPRHNRPIGGKRFVSTRSTYQLFAALKRRYPPKPQGAGQIAYRDGAVM